jgi:hypothetical protein
MTARVRGGARWSLAIVALLGGCVSAGGVGGSWGPPGGALAANVYADAATRRAVDAGVSVGVVSTVTGTGWRAAADGAPTLGAALRRAHPDGVEIDTGGRSFCARSRESADCMFVTVLGASGRTRLAEVDPAGVDAVVIVRTAPPDAESPMQWREELRTGRLFVFLSGWRPPYQP